MTELRDASRCVFYSLPRRFSIPNFMFPLNTTISICVKFLIFIRCKIPNVTGKEQLGPDLYMSRADPVSWVGVRLPGSRHVCSHMSNISNTPASTRVVYKQKRLDLARNLIANLTGSGNPQLKHLRKVKLMAVGD